MRQCSKSSPPGVRVVRRRLADGTVKAYTYARAPRSTRYSADSVHALIAAWKLSPEWAALSSVTQSGYLTYIRHLEHIAQVAASDVRRRDVLAIRDAVAHTRGNGAATGFIRAAGACFAWGVERGILDASPCHRIKRIKGGHLPAWTEEQITHALARLPEHLRRAVLLAAYTGQRRADLCALRWDACDGGVIRLTQGKTGTALVIPMHPVLRREMAAWRKAATSLHVLTTARGKPWIPVYLSRDLARALVEIGLPAGLNVHGLRKAFAAGIANGGGTANEVASLTGHRSLSMVSFYTRSADQERLAGSAIRKLRVVSKG